MIRVDQIDGTWVVLDDQGKVLSKRRSNEDAWRELDRLNGEVGMKAERHNWSFIDNAKNYRGGRRRG